MIVSDDDCSDRFDWRRVERLLVDNHGVAASAAAVMLRSPHDVDDVLQEAVIEAARKLHTLRDPEKSGAWFKAIVARKALDRLRQRKRLLDRSVDLDAVWELAAGCLPPEQHAMASEALRFIDRLPEQQRRAYLLRHYFGLPLKEVATLLRCADNTVSSHLKKAQDKVDKKFSGSADRASRSVLAKVRGSKA